MAKNMINEAPPKAGNDNNMPRGVPEGLGLRSFKALLHWAVIRFYRDLAKAAARWEKKKQRQRAKGRK